MKFSKEFEQWWEKEYHDNHCTMINRVYRAFNAHNEELNRLRKFEKKFRTIQKKCQELEDKVYSLPSKEAVKYQMKLDDELDGFLYL